MTLSHFETQKSFGEAGEKRVMEAFVNAGQRVQWRRWGSRKDLEVGFPHGTEFIEVKNENRYEQSLNACVEMYQGLRERKPSGILVSNATVCVHTFGDMCLAFRRVEMQLHIQSRIDAGHYRVAPFGKSDNGNCGVLVPQMVIAVKPWAEWVAVDELPKSRVFQPVETPL